MNRRKKVIRNLILLIILSLITMRQFGLYFSPISAHKNAERSRHYGPSEVVHIEDYKERKYFLCKYDNFVSCDSVKKSLLFFWSFADIPLGFENEKTKPLDYSWSSSDLCYHVYGIVNDDRIKRVEIILNNGKTLVTTEFYDDLFLFTWEAKDNRSMGYKFMKGYDADNNVIYEEKY